MNEVEKQNSINEIPKSYLQWFEWASVPYWFALFASLIYGTGFLVDFTFKHQLGLSQYTTDAFRTKFIYIGILCLQFPTSVATLLFAYYKMRSEYKRHQDKQARVYWSYILTLLGLLTTFYLTTTFLRPEEWPKIQGWVAGLFIIVPASLFSVRHAEDLIQQTVTKYPFLTVFSGGGNKTVGYYLRYAFVIIEYVAIGLICRHCIGLWWKSFRDGGYVYLLYVSTAFVFIWFTLHYRQYFLKHGLYPPLFAVNVTVAFTCIYLSVLSYAYHIYPYVPVNRGGGDYSADTRVSYLIFDETYKQSIPDKIRGERQTPQGSCALTIIDETPTEIFVTPFYKRKHHEDWRLIGPNHKPALIISLKRDSVSAIYYVDESRVQIPTMKPFNSQTSDKEQSVTHNRR